MGKSHLRQPAAGWNRGPPWVQQTIINPEGDFGTLAGRFDHLVIDAKAHTHPSSLTVLNLEGLDAEDVWHQNAAVRCGKAV
jgi:uncharacterized protein